VILFVAPECDALCACHIITHMLRSEHIQYKIRPASGLIDLQNANETLVKENEELRTIVLINCAGGFDITKVFPSLQVKDDEDEDDEDLQCFVIDSHRPIHLGNIYAPNVYVLDDTLETIVSDNLPGNGSDLSMNESSSSGSSSSSSADEDSDDDPEDSDDSFTRKRKRRDKKYTARKSRRKVLNEYYLATSYGAASSMVAYEISKETSKDTNDLLWLAIVGLTSYYIQVRFFYYYFYFLSFFTHLLTHTTG
jgi:cell division control protein 45